MQIVSGLRLFVPLGQMQGRRVVVLANLKPAKLCAPKQTSEMFARQLLVFYGLCLHPGRRLPSCTIRFDVRT